MTAALGRDPEAVPRLVELADKYGIPKDKFEWVTMPDIQGIQALKQGLVDVSTAHPPFYKGNLDAGALKIADSFETGLGVSAGLSFYWFRNDFIKQHPQAVAGFVRAIKKGQRWANANPELAAKWTEEAIGVPVTGNHYYAEDAIIVEKEIDPWIKAIEDAGNLLVAGHVLDPAAIAHGIAERLQRAFRIGAGHRADAREGPVGGGAIVEHASLLDASEIDDRDFRGY